MIKITFGDGYEHKKFGDQIFTVIAFHRFFDLTYRLMRRLRFFKRRIGEHERGARSRI